jgi:hypothetical protein
MRIQRPRISQPIITQPTITQVTSLEGDGANITGSFSGSFVGELTGPTSASFATRISASEASISTLDGSYATDAELTAASGALAGSITTVQTNLDSASGSLAQSITDNATDISNNGSDITANSSSLAASITTVQSNLDTASGSLAQSITDNATDISDNSNDITANSSSLASSITSNSQSLASDLTSTNDILNSVRTYTGSLKTAISLDSTNVTILGDLTVQGDTTTLNTATLDVEDLNITVAKGAADAAAANGAGLTVDGASATLTYASSGDKWVSNKVFDVPTSGLLINGTAVTSTAVELNYLDGVDSSITSLSLPDSTTISTYGASLVDDADAATARTTLGLDNVTNESKSTMFASPTFTGTVSGVTATHVGLGTSADVQFDSFGVGTAASSITGEIRATGDITAYYSSDERLKENFAPLTGALDKVKAIGGYEFDWKDGIEDVVSKKGHDIGVKAQELQAQYPELVHERDNGYLAVDYIKLNAVLIEAVKELAAKVDELSK